MSGASRMPWAATTRCSTATMSTRCTFPCPTACTWSGRSAPSRRASTCCARSPSPSPLRAWISSPLPRHALASSWRRDSCIVTSRSPRRLPRSCAMARVGAVRTIVSGFTYAQGRANDVRLVPSLGGGALWDVGCYPVSYACLLTGGDHVAATGVARVSASGVDEELTGVLRFPAGHHREHLCRLPRGASHLAPRDWNGRVAAGAEPVQARTDRIPGARASGRAETDRGPGL